MFAIDNTEYNPFKSKGSNAVCICDDLRFTHAA